MSATALSDRVFSVLSAAGRPLKAKEVAAVLGVGADERGDVRDALRDLVAERRVTALEGRRFAVVGAVVADEDARPARGGRPGQPGTGSAAPPGTLPGIVQRKASGAAWFVPDDKTRKDAFLPPAELRAAMDGDRVLARIERGPRGPVATIVRVVARGRTTVTGLLRTRHDRRFGPQAWVEVDDNLLSGPVQILEDGPGGPDPDLAADGDVVEVQIVAPPTTMHAATGRVLRRIGRRGELDTEIERLVVQTGVVRAFPPDALGEAGQLGDDPGDDDIADRLDLRDLAIVTIDGETAKDFDDAVYASRKKRSGSIDVVVCVADVSHYVTADGALDREARRRSTSIYYPGRVIPMLPEALSNGLCSLKPRVPRLCAVVRFSVDEDGTIANERFDFGVMKSRARLTYSLVQRFLDEQDRVDEPYPLPPQPPEATAVTADLDDEVRTSLGLLREAALRIRGERKQRGALDFELPELVVELNPRREPVAIRPLQRAFAHKLIEDLMIAANEAAARFFAARNLPSVYRIHELPDEEKLGRFLSLAGPAYALATGKQLPKTLLADPTSATALMDVMGRLGDHPSRQALDMLLLRSLKQARYSVDNVGHYGLGSTAYLHFTSPIRRYPDLVVHRLLREALAKTAKKARKKARRAEDVDPVEAQIAELEDIAATASEQERKASDLERSIQALHACWLMKDRVGEVHPAVVTGVSEAGAFVRLSELYVEGLVRIAELGPEYFAFDEQRLLLRGERSGEQITLGTRFDVAVADVDFARRQISFVRPRADTGARHRHDRVDAWTRWEPRTDARTNGAPGMQGRGRLRGVDDERGPGSRRGQRETDRGRSEHRGRGRHAEPESRGPAGRGSGHHPPPRGHRDDVGSADTGRGRPERAPRTAADHAEHRDGRRASGARVSPDDLRARHEQETRTGAAGPRAKKKRDEWAAVAEENRELNHGERQRKYDRQQQGRSPAPHRPARPDDEPAPRGKPAASGERPRLRGPDDLRALMESRGGRDARRRDDDDAPRSRDDKATKPKKAKTKTKKAATKKGSTKGASTRKAPR